MQIHVARAGKELGIFPREEVLSRLASGDLLPTDHGWAEGQGDWMLLSAFPGLIPPPTRILPPPPEPPRIVAAPPPEPARNRPRHQKKKAAVAEAPLPDLLATPSTPVEPAVVEAEPAPALNLDSPPPEVEPAKPAQPDEAPEIVRIFLPAHREPAPASQAAVEEPVTVESPVNEQSNGAAEPAPLTEDLPAAEPERRAFDREREEPVRLQSWRAEPEHDDSPREREPIATPAARTVAPVATPETSGEAIASLILGLLSISLLPVLTPIPAIAFGRSAQARIARSRGLLRGGGAAQVGVVTGYIGAAVSAIALLAALALSILGYFQSKDAQERCFENGKVIAMACQSFAADHKGALPESLEALVPKYVTHGSIFVCPYSGPTEPIGYVYFGGDLTYNAKRVLLVSKGFATRKRQAVIYIDGSAELVRHLPAFSSGKNAP